MRISLHWQPSEWEMEGMALRKIFFIGMALSALIVAVSLLAWFRSSRSSPLFAMSSEPVPTTSSAASSSQPNESSKQSPTPTKVSSAERVKQMIVEQLQVDASKVTPDANFRKDLGADDMDLVELVMRFEEAFNLEIPDEDSNKFETVRDANNYIEKRLAGMTNKN